MPDPNQPSRFRIPNWLPLLLALVVLAVIYAPTMQTIPNGSSHDYMVDVGEMQIALNVWGTLHPTGYPLYTLLASVLTHLFTALGVNPALAPGLASLTFGFAALSLLYALLARLTRRPWLAGAAILLLGLARSWWMHQTIAEIYTFSLLLLLILLALALWPAAWSLRKRLWLLALAGGIAVFHHRILILTAPALLVAVWPSLRAAVKARGMRPLLPLIAVALGIGLLGGLQYLYLPLRDWAGGDWVYGRPGTWAGFQQVFSGYEYTYLLAERPAGLGGIVENLGHALGILATEISAPGLILSAGALGALLLWPNRHRRTALILALIALPFLAWVAVLYRSVLAEAVLMPVTLVLVAAVVLAGDVVLHQFDGTAAGATQASPLRWGIVAGMVIWAALLIPVQGPFIQALTHDDNGLRMIALAESIPRAANAAPDPAFVVPWGADHFAVAYGQRLLGRNTDLRLVDHTADFRALYAGGHPVLTRPVTFFVFIPAFWAEWFGVDQVYIYGYTPELVEVRPEPRIVTDPPPPLTEVTAGIVLQSAALRCEPDPAAHLTDDPAAHLTDDPAAHLTDDPAGRDSIVVDLTWAAQEHPDRDLSTFVHLIGAERGDLLAPPGGSDHPAGGWRPTSDWLAGEQVRDLYRLPRVDGAQAVVVGMYAQAADGTFVNYGETALSLEVCAN